MTKIQKRRLRAAKRLHAKVARFAKSRDGVPELRALATVAMGTLPHPFTGDIQTASRTALLYFIRTTVMKGKKMQIDSFPELSKVLKRARHLRNIRGRTSLSVPMKYDDSFTPDYMF